MINFSTEKTRREFSLIGNLQNKKNLKIYTRVAKRIVFDNGSSRAEKIRRGLTDDLIYLQEMPCGFPDFI